MAMTALLVVLALASSVSAASVSSSYPCTWTTPTTGVFYDLTSLWRSNSQENYKGSDGYFDYQMNVCGIVNNMQGCTDSGYAACQFSQAGGTFVASMGTFSNGGPVWSLINLPPFPPESPDNGVMYTFTNGDICWIAGRQQVRTVMTVFRCAETTNQTFSVVEDQTTCTFTITLYTDAACPGGGGAAIKNATYVDRLTRSKWDLSSLDSTLRDYWTEQGAYNYSMNICDLTTKAGQCRDDGHSICQYNYRGDYFAGLGGIRRTPVGKWSLIAADPSVGVRQTYKNGEPCIIAGQPVPRTSIVSFYCNPTGARSFSLQEDTATCTYNFKWAVAEGCPSRA